MYKHITNPACTRHLLTMKPCQVNGATVKKGALNRLDVVQTEEWSRKGRATEHYKKVAEGVMEDEARISAETCRERSDGWKSKDIRLKA